MPSDAGAGDAAARFYVVMMTSTACSLGVVPLVLASGASARALLLIGIATLSGMIVSTCFAVVLASFRGAAHRHKAKNDASSKTPRQTFIVPMMDLKNRQRTRTGKSDERQEQDEEAESGAA